MRLTQCVVASVFVSACAPYRVPSTIEPLGDRLAATQVELGEVFSVRVLSDGRVLIGDDPNTRVLLFDKHLANPIVVADSTAATGAVYAHSGGSVRPWLGDSSLFMLSPLPYATVIDPDGKLARRAWYQDGHLRRDVLNSVQSNRGTVAMEIPPRRMVRDSLFTLDTFTVVRGSLTSSRRDTVGTFVREHPLLHLSNPDPRSRFAVMLRGDAMTMLSGGSIAIVRASDYHIDWIDANGRRRSTPPVPHEWHVLTRDEKVAIIDTARARARQVGFMLTAKIGDSVISATRRDTVGGSWLVTTLASLPDTVPPFGSIDAAVADHDNHIWVRQEGSRFPFTVDPQGPGYDVIDAKGRLIRRVSVPPGSIIRGFGPGIVYLAMWEDGHHRLVAYRIP